MAVQHPEAVSRLSSAPRRAESRPGRIGPISLGMKQMGARNAGNPHVACDVEGAGDVVWVGSPGATRARQPSTLLMSGDGKRGVAEWPKLPRPSSTLPLRHVAAVQQFGRFRNEADIEAEYMRLTSP